MPHVIQEEAEKKFKFALKGQKKEKPQKMCDIKEIMTAHNPS